MKLREIEVVYKKTSKRQPKEKISGPGILVNLFKDLEDDTKEKFICVHLDTQNRINCYEVVAMGSLNECTVHPREVFKATLLTNSASVIFIHNHPSGEPTPSKEDIALTKTLKKAGEILGIRILDHIIIGKKGYTTLLSNPSTVWEYSR
jgi:DNA repair protein RadC